MERFKEVSETEKILNELPLVDLVEFINAAFKRRQAMDLTYGLELERDLTLAMSILDKRTGYGVL